MWASAVGLRWSVVVLRGRTHSRPRMYRICRIVRALKRKFHIRENHKCVHRKVILNRKMSCVLDMVKRIQVLGSSVLSCAEDIDAFATFEKDFEFVQDILL